MQELPAVAPRFGRQVGHPQPQAARTARPRFLQNASPSIHDGCPPSRHPNRARVAIITSAPPCQTHTDHPGPIRPPVKTPDRRPPERGGNPSTPARERGRASQRVLALAVGDAAFGEIVRRQLHAHFVARNNANEIFPHAPRRCTCMNLNHFSRHASNLAELTPEQRNDTTRNGRSEIPDGATS